MPMPLPTHDWLQQGLRLAEQTRQFLASPPSLPVRPHPPALPPDQPLSRVLAPLLLSAPGLVFATAEEDRTAFYHWLTLQMPHLAAAGLQRLYLQAWMSDLHADALQRYQTNDATDAEATLVRALGNDKATLAAGRLLLAAARRHRVQLLGLDNRIRRTMAGLPEALAPLTASHLETLRLAAFNYLAQQNLNNLPSSQQGRWLALVDTQHACRSAGVPGIAELTGALALRVERGLDYLRPDPGGVTMGSDRAAPRWLQGDLLCSDRPAPTGTELSDGLRQSTVDAFRLDRDDDGQTLVLRTRRNTRLRRARLSPHGNGNWRLTDNGQVQLFADPDDLLQSLHEQGLPPLLPGQLPSWNDENQALRQLRAQRYQQRHHELLLHLVWFATDDERTAFQAGRAAGRVAGADDLARVLSALGLDAADESELMQVFVALIGTGETDPLTPEQQGALLEAIQQRRGRRLDRLQNKWQQRQTRLGARHISRIAHNRYLARADHPNGLCSALTTHVAALSQRSPLGAVADSPLVHYLERLERALTGAQDDETRLLDLALLEWAWSDDRNKFGADTEGQALHDLAAVWQALAKIVPGEAFELTLGHHAVSLGRGDGYWWLAEPNQGYVEFADRVAFSRALRRQEADWRTLFPGVLEEWAFNRGYRLRRYRQDLSNQALWAEQDLPGRLADLGRSAPLAEWFTGPLDAHPGLQRLTDTLLLREYRARLMQPDPDGLAATTRLRQIVARHGAGRRLEGLRTMTFVKSAALLGFQQSADSEMEWLRISRTHTDDIAYLQAYQDFWLRLLAPDSLTMGGHAVGLDSILLGATLPLLED